MPKRFIDPKKASHYQLVYKSVEDQTFKDENTQATLVKTERVGNRRARCPNEMNILREEMWMDMQTMDDSAEKNLFDDAEECDFDQDFIQQMMEAPEGEEEEEEEDGYEYPKHEKGDRDVDHEFEALMKHEYRQHQLEVEQDDPRADGLLPADAYVPAMQDFVQDQKPGQFIPPKQERGQYLDRLEVTGEEIFHQNRKGQFMTVLRSKKDYDIAEHWEEEQAAAKAHALDRLRQARLAGGEALLETAGEGGLAPGDEGYDELARDGYEYIRVREKPTEKWDCQTILTTASTLYNHPTVIPTESKRIKMKRGVPVCDQGRLTAKALTRLGEEGAVTDGVPNIASAAAAAPGSDVSSQLADLQCVRRSGAISEEEYREAADRVMARADAASRDLDEDSLITVWDTAAGRPANETAEEKRARKKQAKEEARMKRMEKKDLKMAYRAENIRSRFVQPKANQQKAMLSLS